METNEAFDSLVALIGKVHDDYLNWNTDAFPWFRGESASANPLRPKLFIGDHNENRLLQQFRVKAPALGLGSTPPLERTDQWLFLAQHVGLPTRLLDWSEGLLLAVYFALKTESGGNKPNSDQPAVWMLNPHELNKLTDPDSKPNVFSLTWLNKPEIPARKEDIYNLLDEPSRYMNLKRYNDEYRVETLGNVNIKAAWSAGRVEGTEYPVAILPTYVHPRMTTQKSCFTIWGKNQEGLSNMPGIGEKILKSYSLDIKAADKIVKELKFMGITGTTLFADLDNLSRELRELF